MTSEWAGTAAAYDRSFASLCEGTADAVLASLGAPAGHARLLDVGTGTGRLAARASGLGWSVTGVDAEASMVRAARRRLPNAAVVLADAAALPWPDGAFEAVTANFVVNHLADPAAGVREMARVCRGRISATIWPSDVSAMNALWNAMVAQSGATPLRGTRLPQERDFARTPAGLAGLFEAAGLAAVAARTVEWTWAVRPADLWAAVDGGIAVIGRTYLAQEPAVRSRMRATFDRLSAAATVDGTVRLPTTAILVTGSCLRRGGLGT